MKNFIHAAAGGGAIGFFLGMSNISITSWNWWFLILTMTAWYITKPENNDE